MKGGRKTAGLQSDRRTKKKGGKKKKLIGEHKIKGSGGKKLRKRSRKASVHESSWPLSGNIRAHDSHLRASRGDAISQREFCVLKQKKKEPARKSLEQARARSGKGGGGNVKFFIILQKEQAKKAPPTARGR